jgi:hypothetical protein
MLEFSDSFHARISNECWNLVTLVMPTACAEAIVLVAQLTFC